MSSNPEPARQQTTLEGGSRDDRILTPVRVPLTAQLIPFGLILLVLFRDWQHRHGADPAAWLLLGGLVLLSAAAAGLMIWMDSRKGPIPAV
jgi:hypothetical protein